MTFAADRNLDRPAGDDVEETTHGLGVDGSRPLTSDERAAAEQDVPLRERVYAPASERVPKEPVPGHRDMVEHVDPATPERQAVSEEPTTVPAFTGVSRASDFRATEVTVPPPTPYVPGWRERDRSAERWEPIGTRGPRARMAWLVLPVGAAVGVWLYARWRREHNKPINRLRRQALHTAAEIRDHVPDGSSLLRPTLGVMATLASSGVMIWRQAQQQKAGRAVRGAMSDADWQKRLNMLKERWHPSRLELEKISISRHR